MAGAVLGVASGDTDDILVCRVAEFWGRGQPRAVLQRPAIPSSRVIDLVTLAAMLLFCVDHNRLGAAGIEESRNQKVQGESEDESERKEE